MLWYVAFYLVVFVAVGLAGLVEDWRSRRPLWYQAAMLVTLAVGVLFILAFAYESVARAVGVWLWTLLVFGLAMETWSLAQDVRELRAAELSRAGALATILIVTALTLPAYVLGAIAAARAVT